MDEIEDDDLEEGKQRNAVVGLMFTFVVLAAIVIGIIGLAKWQSRGVEYSIRFKNAKSLQPGHKVVLSGVPIGEVRKIELVDEGQVLVTVRIDDEYADRVKQNSTAVIANPTLVNVSGEKIIEIHNGKSDGDQPIVEGSVIEGQEGRLAIKAWQVKDKLDNLGEGVSEVARSLAEKLSIYAEELKDIPESPEVKKALEELALLSEELKEKGKEGLAAAGEKWADWKERFGPVVEDWKEKGKKKASEALKSTTEAFNEKKDEWLENRKKAKEAGAAETPEETEDSPSE